MPHVPGIGGFVGQMGGRSLAPLSVRAVKHTAANAAEQINVLLPTYAVGDLLLVTICVLGPATNFVDPPVPAAPWTALAPYTHSTSSSSHYTRSFYWFATDLSQTAMFLGTSTGAGTPDWGGSAVAIIGADPAKLPIASNAYVNGATSSSSHDPSGTFPGSVPAGPTLYVAQGMSRSANISGWSASYPDNRTQQIVANGARPHLATFKNLVGGTLDPSAYTLSAAAGFAFQQVAVMGDS